MIKTPESTSTPPFQPGDFIIAVKKSYARREGLKEAPAPLLPSGHGYDDEVVWKWHVSPGDPWEFASVSRYRRATVEELITAVKANDSKILELMGKSHRMCEAIKRMEFIASKGESR